MRVNSDLLKHFEFLTVKFDGTHGFLYSMVKIGRICVVNVVSGIIYQWIINQINNVKIITKSILAFYSSISMIPHSLKHFLNFVLKRAFKEWYSNNFHEIKE